MRLFRGSILALLSASAVLATVPSDPPIGKSGLLLVAAAGQPEVAPMPKAKGRLFV